MDRYFLIRSFMNRRTVNRHSVLAVVITLILALTVGLTLSLAQTSNKLKTGDTVNGTLSAANFAQVYSFDGKTGDAVSILATSKTAGLTLAVILTGPDGTILNQTAKMANSAVSIANFTLPADGTYLITVLRGNGATGTGTGNFTLALTGTTTGTGTGTTNTSAASGATINLQQGMSVALTWNTADDLNIEVRDPVGGAINYRTPTLTSGARLSNNVNANCTNLVTNNPTETVNWPAGAIAAGSYEVNIYFVQHCNGSAAVPPPTESASATSEATGEVTSGTDGAATEAPATNTTDASSAGGVNFAVTVTVNGQALEPMRGTLLTNQQYVSSFRLDGADKVTLNPGAVNLGVKLDDFTAKIAAPIAFGTRTSVTGTITGTNAADAWSFDVGANANKNIVIGMAASSGSLDPFLVLMDSNGTVITSNDDANDTTRNSQISQTLAAGRYIVLASRFALQIGGTEGNYTLTLGNTGTTVAGNTGTTGTGTGAQPTLAPTSASSSPLPSGSIEVSLTWNTVADLRLLIRDPSGVSVYSDQLSPDNSGIMERLGNFKCQNTTTTPQTYAYWPTNFMPAGTYEVSVWLNDRCQNQQTLPQYNLVVRVRGTEVINHSDRPDPNKAHYLTTFTVDANGQATKGSEGVVRPQAPDVTTQVNNNPEKLTYATSVTGKIDATSPFVVYTFDARKGDRIAIVMRNAGGNLDPRLFLLTFNGTQINENDDASASDSNSRIEQNITADGTYIVVATRYGVELGGTSGNYELTIARLNR